MNTKNRIFSYFGVFAAMMLVLGLYPVSAQNGGLSIKISPVRFDDLTGNAGEQLTGSITLSNPGSNQLTLYPSAQNFLPKSDNEEGVPELTQNNTPYAIQDWVSFDKTKLDIAPGAKDDVKFFINIPKDAQPGGHYGALLFSTKAAQGSPENTQLKVESAVSALVLLNVNGNVKESASVDQFTATAAADGTKVDFTLRFKNDGNSHVKPNGNIVITNWLGTKVAELPIESENVLPGSYRKITTTWQSPGFLFGKYTATAEGKYGTTGNFTASTSFGDYHLGTILIILIIIVILALFIKMSSSKDYKDELSKEIKDEMKR